MSHNKSATDVGFLDFPIYNLPEVDVATLNFRGEGNKQVLVIANEGDVENDLDFLYNVLSPLDLEKQDVYILLTSNIDLKFADLCRNVDFSKLIIFGKKARSVGLQLHPPMYRPLNIAKKQILFVDGIEIFLEEKEKGGTRPKAKQLWLALKSFLTN